MTQVVQKPAKSWLVESSVSKPGKIDREAGKIEDVLVLGRSSRNNREYTESCLQKAVSEGIYENMDVCTNHPKKENLDVHGNREFMESWGVLRESRVAPEGIKATLYYLKSHPLTETILERAEKFPEKFGLSQNAYGMEKRQGGKKIVESIDVVRSVDLVRNPATAKTLWESEQQMQTLKQVIESIDEKVFEDKAHLLEMMTGEEPIASPDMPVDAVDTEEPHIAALRAMAVSIFDDSALDDKAKLQKLKTIFKFKSEMSAKKEEPAATATTESQKVDAEQTKLLTSLVESNKAILENNKALEQRVLISDLLLESGINRADLTADQVEAMKKCDGEPALRALIESWPPVARGGRKPNLNSSRDDKLDKPVTKEDVESFAAAIKGW